MKKVIVIICVAAAAMLMLINAEALSPKPELHREEIQLIENGLQNGKSVFEFVYYNMDDASEVYRSLYKHFSANGHSVIPNYNDISSGVVLHIELDA